MEWRRRILAHARASALKDDRVAYLSQLAVGKRVLDIGVVEHTAAASQQSTWLHERLCRVARTCLGVDILEEDVQRLQQKGYNVLCADVTREPLPGVFELIVCGEVVEHLDQPGRLFENVSRMLEENGRFVLTTPNPWYLNVVLRNMFGGASFTDSADHVAWYDPGTLCELASRHSLTLNRFSGVLVAGARTVLGRMILRHHSWLVRLGLRREAFARTMVYEFMRPRIDKPTAYDK